MLTREGLAMRGYAPSSNIEMIRWAQLQCPADAGMPNSGSSDTTAAVPIMVEVAASHGGNIVNRARKKSGTSQYHIHDSLRDLCSWQVCEWREYGGAAKLNTVHMAMAGTPSLLPWQEQIRRVALAMNSRSA